MGNFGCASCNVGIDSCQSVDTAITNALFPNPSYISKTEIINLNDRAYHDLSYVTSKTGKNISMLKIVPNRQTQSDKMIIYSHGNAENLYLLSPFLQYLSNEFGIPVVSYDYIGYGITEGVPSEEGCYESIETIVNNQLKLNPNAKIMLMGQSLGTGVIIDYISKNNWKYPVMLISSYKSIPRVIVDMPIESLLKHNKFNSINKIDQTVCPIKFLHGKNDTLISYHHTVDLFDRLPNKKFKPSYFENIGHNDIIDVLTTELINEVLNSF